MIEVILTSAQKAILSIVTLCEAEPMACQPTQRWIGHAVHQSRNGTTQDPLYNTVYGQYAAIKVNLRNDVVTLIGLGLIAARGSHLRLTEVGKQLILFSAHPTWVDGVVAKIKGMSIPSCE